MNFHAFLFATVSFISVLMYYVIGKQANWSQKSVNDFETAYWNAFQTFIWSFGIIGLRGTPPVTIWAIVPILPTAILYGLIAEQPGMDFDLTGDKPLTSIQIGVLSGVGILVFVYIAAILFNQDYSSPLFVLSKFIPLFLFAIWLLSWLAVNKESKTTSVTKTTTDGEVRMGVYVPGGTTTTTTTTNFQLHIHHWIIGVIGFLLSKDYSVYSQIASGVFWGIFCQEAGAYGIAIPSDPRNSYDESDTYNQSNLGPNGTQRSR